MVSEQTVIDRLVSWAQGRDDIRALILYSSRADQQAILDPYSDYDVLLAVREIHPLHADPGWLEGFGKVLVVFSNPIEVDNGFESFGFITHYQDGVKIDYGVYPVEYLRWIKEQFKLPTDLDHGYQVLLDKDGLSEGLPSPTYKAHLPIPPTADEYRAVVEEFFNDALYVAKHLWRDNLFSVKLSLDHIMKFTCLRKMLQWQVQINGHWQVRLGGDGQGLGRYVDPVLWAELESTYVGAGAEENWQALFRIIELFRKVAREVGQRLGYTYPDEIHEGVDIMITNRRDNL